MQDELQKRRIHILRGDFSILSQVVPTPTLSRHPSSPPPALVVVERQVISLGLEWREVLLDYSFPTWYTEIKAPCSLMGRRRCVC